MAAIPELQLAPADQPPKSKSDAAFLKACAGGHLEEVRQLLALTGAQALRLHAWGKQAFRDACERGHVEVARELLALTGDRAFDLRHGASRAFYRACIHGHTELARLLLTLEGDRRVDVHVHDDTAFSRACWWGHVNVVRMLLALEGDRAIDVHAREGALLEVCSLPCWERTDNRVSVVAMLLRAEAWSRDILTRCRWTFPGVLCWMLRMPQERPWLRRSPALLAAWCDSPPPGEVATAVAKTRRALRDAHWAVRGPAVLARTAARARRLRAHPRRAGTVPPHKL